MNLGYKSGQKIIMQNTKNHYKLPGLLTAGGGCEEAQEVMEACHECTALVDLRVIITGLEITPVLTARCSQEGSLKSAARRFDHAQSTITN